MMSQQPNPERVQVAATLRRMRERAGVNRDGAADVLGCSPSKISDLEVGRSRPKPAELEKLLDHYGVPDDERAELITFARTSRGRRPASPYTTAVIPANVQRAVDLQAQAVSTIFYSADLIPGPLQVRPYAEAMLSWDRDSRPDEVAKLLDLRMERPAVLTRTDRKPVRYWCILGEAALRSGIGGPEVMREQLAHLIEVNRTLENVVIQILPLGSGPHPFIGFTVEWDRFPEPAPDMLSLDSHGRSIIRDYPPEVARAAHHLDLLKAKALGLDESTAFLEQVRRETK